LSREKMPGHPDNSGVLDHDRPTERGFPDRPSG
jgi:hypothetical protein